LPLKTAQLLVLKKKERDFIEPLGKAIEDFYKYYEELNKGKVKSTK
jgi:hypothetical protein